MKVLKKYAELKLLIPVTKCIVTVPAHFNALQRALTIKASQIAGLKPMQLLEEPTAAALCNRIEKRHDAARGIILVFDLGGGTYDLSILEISPDSIITKEIGGDQYLGGRDIDNLIIEDFKENC